MSRNLVLKYINNSDSNEPINQEEINVISRNSGISELHLENEFDQVIDGLDYIKTLIINSTEFNSNIINCKKLVKLVINSEYFNSVIEFPETLEYLKIVSEFYDNPLNLNHTKLKYLHIKSLDFNHPLDNLPDTLETLDIWSEKYTHQINNLPPSLINFNLYISSSYKHDFIYLPPKIRKLDIKFAHSSSTFYTIPLENLPNITELYLLNYFGDFNILPNSIEFLDIKYSYDNDYNRNDIIRNVFNKLVKLPENLKQINYQSDIYKSRQHTFNANPHLKHLNILALITAKVNLSGVIVNGEPY
jgi:hypothetical protein